jgi:hypothetical protein
MKWLGKARFFSATVAVVAVVSWITGTNHCFLGLMKGPGNPAVSASPCPLHPQESGTAHSGSSGMLACCQGLLSSEFALAKTQIPLPVAALRFFSPVDFTLPESPWSIILSTEYDTGPPLTSVFVETVLQRSLPENAPPLVS